MDICSSFMCGAVYEAFESSSSSNKSGLNCSSARTMCIFGWEKKNKAGSHNILSLLPLLAVYAFSESFYNNWSYEYIYKTYAYFPKVWYSLCVAIVWLCGSGVNVSEDTPRRLNISMQCDICSRVFCIFYISSETNEAKEISEWKLWSVNRNFFVYFKSRDGTCSHNLLI